MSEIITKLINKYSDLAIKSEDNLIKIEYALHHSFYKMVENKAKIDGEFVFARPDNSIYFMKEKNLLKEIEEKEALEN